METNNTPTAAQLKALHAAALDCRNSVRARAGRSPVSAQAITACGKRGWMTVGRDADGIFGTLTVAGFEIVTAEK